MILARDTIERSQMQPASLDLRLGPKAYRVRASFLPGKNRTVAEQLQNLKFDEISLSGAGAVLERGCVYVIPLLESLVLPNSISAVANPKSSTGRLDIFTRLITDRSEIFDHVERGYKGQLYAEVSPRSFSVRVHEGSKLNQIRFRRLNSSQFSHTDFTLTDSQLAARHRDQKMVDGDELNLRDGLVLRVALSTETIGDIVGYRAQKHTDIIDVDRVGAYDVADFWEPVRSRPDKRLILDPDEFYILASQEKLHIPRDLAGRNGADRSSNGRVPCSLRRLLRSGFRDIHESGQPGSRGVLEVRSHEVPFILEDGQVIGRLVYEKMAEAPQSLYGQSGGSNYQGQGLKLSKHFVMT